MRLTALFVFLGAAAIASLVDAEAKKVLATQLPPAVWKTLQTQSGGKQPGHIEREEQDGEVRYEAAFPTTAGEERTITVREDGTLLSAEVTLGETPAAVQKTITAQLNGGSVDAIDKTLDDGEVSYAVDFTSKAGQEKSLSVAEDGALLSLEVGLEETPTAVQAAIKAQAGAGKISEIEKNLDEDAVTYEVDFTTQAGSERSFTVNAAGRLVSLEVALEETTPAAQQTIKNRIGAGRLLRVAQSYGEKQKVKSYEVDGIVNGRPVGFKVGLKGKFLGTLD